MEETIAMRKQRRRRRRRPIWPAVALALLAVAVVVGIALAAQDRELRMTLVGDRNMTLEFGTDFTDPGAVATYGGKPLEVQLQTQGAVNPDKLGSYTVTYSVTYRGQTQSIQRTVHVVDTVAPTIVLMHMDNSFLLPGQEYREEGFVAEDNYDGNITHKVQRMIVDGVVHYRVEDSSGNVTEVQRPLKYDREAPVLTLAGAEFISIAAGSVYTEPGYSALDNAEGDISGRVQVSGRVDIYTPGVYMLHYKVQDASGNVSEAVRTVEVTGSPVNGNVIYLTFDDGPSEYTDRLLDILAKYDVKVTFFVVGTSKISVLNRIAAEGHAIALHSNTHKYDEIYVSEEAFYKDLNALRQKIRDLCGVDTMLMRFPGGSSNTISRRYCKGIMTKLTQSVVANGYRYFDWNVDSMDAGGAKTAEEVYQNVIQGVQGHKESVVLQHDIYGFSVDAVEMIIQWGLANGYTFRALDANSPGAHQTVVN